jgi:FixJ family two-component response regulator
MRSLLLVVEPTRAGADAFVSKPIEPRAIVETAERLLPPTPRRRRAG